MKESDTRIRIEETEELSLREAVYQTLRKAILTGRFSPNERLTEVQLGELLGTSRTPIREALRKLELEGLVVIIPRSGARVAPITAKQLKDVLEVRRTLDVLAAQLACRRITEEQKLRLEAAAREFEDSVSSRDKTRIAKADVSFHEIIAEAADNGKLVQILNSLADQIYRYRYEYIKDDNSYNRLIEEHWALFHGIADKDEAAAAETARKHVDNQENSILKSLRL